MIYRSIDLKWLGHSGFIIKTGKGKIVYIDPYKLTGDEYELDRADYIFITHSHYDHCSIEDIQKIAGDGTTIICPADVSSKMSHISAKVKLKIVGSDEQMQLEDNIRFWTIPAYNINKSAHTQDEDWLGYLIQIDEVKIYHAGDTDLIPEMKKLSTSNIDIALLPVGGTYTMNAGEAAKAAAVIKPKLVIPMHWGTIIGDKTDVDIFAKYCSAEGVEVRVLEKGK